VPSSSRLLLVLLKSPCCITLPVPISTSCPMVKQHHTFRLQSSWGNSLRMS
jgi:hypothetical protein